MDVAERWFQKMLDAGIEPNMVSLNALVFGCSRKGEAKQARSLYEEVRKWADSKNMMVKVREGDGSRLGTRRFATLMPLVRGDAGRQQVQVAIEAALLRAEGAMAKNKERKSLWRACSDDNLRRLRRAGQFQRAHSAVKSPLSPCPPTSLRS